MNILLQQVHSLIDRNDRSRSDEAALTLASEKLKSLRLTIASTNSSTEEIILALKQSTTNFGANYYWVIFVLIYGGVYLFQ